MAGVVEIVASTITLAGLFGSCIQAFEAFYIAKEKKSELRALFLQFKLQEARLWSWGKALGWDSDGDSDSETPILFTAECQTLVRASLQHFFELITDGTALKDEYGCRLVDDALTGGALTDDGREPSGRLAAVFDKFRVVLTAHAGAAKQTATWVIRDRKRFKKLVEVLRDAIWDLKDATEHLAQPRKQDEAAIRRLNFIDDNVVLDAVADAAQKEWPEISEAASRRSERLSSALSEHRDVRQWVQATHQWDLDIAATEDIETWTLTECKRQYLRLYHAHTRLMPQIPEPEDRVLSPSAQTDNKSPLRFKDAMDRNYRFPFDRCKEWRDMHNLINKAFAHVEELRDHVRDGHFDIVGPEGEIIMPDYWEIAVELGMEVRMLLWEMRDKNKDGIEEILRYGKIPILTLTEF